MRAVVQDRYGEPTDVLRVEKIERPVAGDGEVLVQVRASSVHVDIWHAVTGRPWAGRFFGSGLLRPKDRVPGMDLAGRVEAVGPGVTRFAPGDDVFGATRLELSWRNGGAFAEYAAVPAEALAQKPESVDFGEAAAVTTSGFIALLNLQCGDRVEPGQRVLVNGAGGAVGGIALQVAKARGAHVTGVDHTAKLELMRSLGADEVVDYTSEDFTRGSERYDLVFDVASNLSLRVAKSVLTPNGVYILIGHDQFGKAKGRVLGSIPRVFALMLISTIAGRHLPQRLGPLPTVGEATALLAQLLREGKVTPIIDRAYPLEEVREAMRRLQEGIGIGRIVVGP
jgi:NADPH:quinone reductase-like Zn-dependent oxidoreductase